MSENRAARMMADNPPPVPPKREAECVYCHHRTDTTNPHLAFWESGYWRQGVRYDDHDSFYCGCRGWD